MDHPRHPFFRPLRARRSRPRRPTAMAWASTPPGLWLSLCLGLWLCVAIAGPVMAGDASPELTWNAPRAEILPLPAGQDAPAAAGTSPTQTDTLAPVASPTPSTPSGAQRLDTSRTTPGTEPDSPAQSRTRPTPESPSQPDSEVTTPAPPPADAQAEDLSPSIVRDLISFNKILVTILILTFTYFLNRLLILVLDNLAERAVRYRLLFKRLAPITRILIWSLSLYIVIAGVIAPPFETIVAISASVGIAVGFASQDILKNIFGGIIVILDKPFQVGDKIQVGEFYGEVTSIGLRSSRIVTPDDSLVTIPNSELMNQAVSNSNSGELDCQVVAEIYLPATIDVQAVKTIARRAVYASPYAYLAKPVAVIVLNELHERSFVYKLRVKAYVLDIRYEFPFKSNMTELITMECARLGMVPTPPTSPAA